MTYKELIKQLQEFSEDELDQEIILLDPKTLEPYHVNLRPLVMTRDAVKKYEECCGPAPSVNGRIIYLDLTYIR